MAIGIVIVIVIVIRIRRWGEIKSRIKIRIMSQLRKTEGARAPDWANSRAGFLAISV